MLTWEELDTKFRELGDPGGYVRLDIQWGAAGEHLHLSGHFDVNNEQRFEAIARLAGEKLRSLLKPDTEDSVYILDERDPLILWYKALWKYSPSFELGIYAFQKSDEGEDLGTIFTGSVLSVFEASATLALNLLSSLGEPENPEHTEKDTRELDVIDIKPNFYGLGINLNEGWRRFAKWLRGNNA